MKSGVQLNFIERRLRADRALSQLVQMTRETTETLSSREQRGFYRLEAPSIAKSNPVLRAARSWIGTVFSARWLAFSTIVLVLVRGVWARLGVIAQKARARARIVWVCDMAPVLAVVQVRMTSGLAKLRKRLARMHGPRTIAR